MQKIRPLGRQNFKFSTFARIRSSEFAKKLLDRRQWRQSRNGGGHQRKPPQGKKTTSANFMLQAWLHEHENAGQWREGNPYRLDPTYLRSSCFPTFSDLRFHANIPSSCLDDADFVVMIYPMMTFFFVVRDGPCWGLTNDIMVLRYLFARHNTHSNFIRGRARGVDAIQNIFPPHLKTAHFLVFEGHYVPSRCSEEIVDAAIVSARLITLHPNAESSSITWIEAQIKTFGALTHPITPDSWVHYTITCMHCIPSESS